MVWRTRSGIRRCWPLAGLILLSACGGSTNKAGTASTSSSSGASNTTAAVASATTLPQPAASSLVVHLSDMPAGWSSEPVSKSHTCASIDPVYDKYSGPSVVDVAYQGSPQGAPVFDEAVIVYQSAGQATRDFQALINQFDACKSFKISSGGETGTGTVRSMSLGSYGDKSAAYQQQVTVSGITLGLDEVFVVKRNILAIAAYGDVNPDAATAQEFITKAVTKLG